MTNTTYSPDIIEPDTELGHLRWENERLRADNERLIALSEEDAKRYYSLHSLYHEAKANNEAMLAQLKRLHLMFGNAIAHAEGRHGHR